MDNRFRTKSEQSPLWVNLRTSFVFCIAGTTALNGSTTSLKRGKLFDSAHRHTPNKVLLGEQIHNEDRDEANDISSH